MDTALVEELAVSRYYMPAAQPVPPSLCTACGIVLEGDSSSGLCIRCESKSERAGGLKIAPTPGEALAADSGFADAPTRHLPLKRAQESSPGFCTDCGDPLSDPSASGEMCDCCLVKRFAGPVQEHDPQSMDAAEAQPQPIPPVEIPGYRMIRFIGRGGMGVVWLAEQLGTKRRVAIKFCRGDRFGFDGNNRAVQRFENEIELAARLNHPHIAHILVGGEVEGIPYCVMEFIEGQNLAEHVREQGLESRAIVTLLAKVAEAVQHAHQNAIIHRDLKPSNIIVSAQGEPKVLDFGLAKALEATEEAARKLSQTGLIVGTVAYMAPEQAGAGTVDTRSDVYALGVILYELLLGRNPHDLGGPDHVVLRGITNEEPMPPRRVKRGFDAELEMLLLKALSKLPEERYRTAGELADELGRWLRNEPLAAGRTTAFYFARKWLQRRRVEVSIAAGMLVLTAVSVALYMHNTLIADDAAKKGVQLEKSNEILTSIFTTLDPKLQGASGELLRVHLGELLANAADQIEDEAIGDPVVVARIRERLGESLNNLGQPNKAIAVLTKVHKTRAARLGENHPDTLKSMDNLGVAYRDDGQVETALSILKRALELSEATLGRDNRNTLIAMNDLAATLWDAGKSLDALRLFEQVERHRKKTLGRKDRLTLESMNNLGAAYYAVGRLKEALTLLDEALALKEEVLGHDDPGTLETMSNVAVTCQKLGILDRALPLAEETFKLRGVKLGPNHPLTLESMDNLAVVYGSAGRTKESIDLAEQALAKKKVILGNNHQKTLISMNNLAMSYRDVGRSDDAFKLAEETLDLMTKTLKRDHPTTLEIMNNLGVAYQLAGKVKQAIPLLEETLQYRRTQLAPDDPLILESLHNLAAAYLTAGEAGNVVPLYEESLWLRNTKYGPQDPSTIRDMQSLAIAYREADELDLALVMFQETHKHYSAKKASEKPAAIKSVSHQMATSYLEYLKARGVARLPEDASLLADIALLLSETNHLEQAAAVAQRSLELDPGNEAATNVLAAIRGRGSDAKE